MQDETGGACSTHGEHRNAHSPLMENFKGESLFGRPKGTWEDYIRTDLKGTWCEDVEWNDVALSSDKWTALEGGGGSISGSTKCGEILD